MDQASTNISVCLPVYVVPEVIVRRVGDDGTETDREREETLGDGRVPNIWFQKFRPFRGDEEEDPGRGTFQGHCPDEESQQDDVWENCEEVGELAGAFHALERYQNNGRPTDEEAQRQLPVWQSNPVVDAVFLLKHHFSGSSPPWKRKTIQKIQKTFVGRLFLCEIEAPELTESRAPRNSCVLSCRTIRGTCWR